MRKLRKGKLCCGDIHPRFVAEDDAGSGFWVFGVGGCVETEHVCARDSGIVLRQDREDYGGWTWWKIVC